MFLSKLADSSTHLCVLCNDKHIPLLKQPCHGNYKWQKGGWINQILAAGEIKFDKWQVKIEICQQRLTKHIRFPSSSNIPYHQCIMCFTFCATQQAAPCVFSPTCVSSVSCSSPELTWDPGGQSRYREPASLLRGSVPGKTSSQNERWGKLGHEFRSFHPKVFTLTDMSAHRVG